MDLKRLELHTYTISSDSINITVFVVILVVFVEPYCYLDLHLNSDEKLINFLTERQDDVCVEGGLGKASRKGLERNP